MIEEDEKKMRDKVEMMKRMQVAIEKSNEVTQTLKQQMIEKQ